jgi:uncharacterized protein (TIGR02171 family)
MNIRIKSMLASLIASIIACTPLTPDNEQPVDPPHLGMKKIVVAGKSFMQGWDDPGASLDEKPAMPSSFTYDYWIDSIEVTRKRFADFTGRHPLADSSPADRYPVTMVTWFDAVIFCNARSNAEGLDTVYCYAGRKTLPTGSVVDLTGLRSDCTRDGYRLPTEAEWEFAARGGSSALPFSRASDSSAAQSYAWFAANSGGAPHPVATKPPQAFGLYDMAGNVFEWTNDWKGPYSGRSIVNALGAPQPDAEYQKVVKGGAYNYGLTNLRPSHRSATYATTLSTACEYVGFRCARGAIPDGRFITIGQQSNTSNPVSITASLDMLRSFADISRAKVVFVNCTDDNRTLCVVDFSETFPLVREYTDDRNVYMPTMSPDSRFVAYCSRNEGLSGPGRITIRSLDTLNSPRTTLDADSAYIPRWWVSGDTNIVYTNSSIYNSSPAWETTRTFRWKISGGKPVGGPHELIGDGSYHDGIAADGSYAVTGYDRLMVRSMSTSAERQLFVSPGNGKDGYGSVQVCNVSISPQSAQCLFLDFGYPRISSATGCSYGAHQYLFVADFADSIVNALACPTDETSWDYPEWSNREQFAIASCRNASEQSHAIYIVDLKHPRYLPLMTGVEVQQPSLWIGDIHLASKFALDSIGLYNDPPASMHQANLASKLLLFWRRFESLEVAIVGSSQAMFGLNPQMLTGVRSINLAACGGDFAGQRSIIEHYLLNQCRTLKMVISSLDPGWLNNPDGNEMWKQGVGQSIGFKYDSAHEFWCNGVSDEFKTLMGGLPVPVSIDTVWNGFLPFLSQNWGQNVPPYSNSITWTVKDTFFNQNFATIQMLSDTLQARRIHWLMIDFPNSPWFKNTPSYGTYGPSRQTARDILQKLGELEAANPYFHLYDANLDGNHDYSSAEAYDENHLSQRGAEKLSLRVDSLLHLFLDQSKTVKR